jgi:tetratricopeptide (TPR) repeat protein
MSGFRLDPATLLRAAYCYLREGRPDAARDCCETALAQAPDHPETLRLCGMLLGDAGRLHDAADCFRRLTALQPDFAEAHGNLGIALQRLGRPDEAIESFRQALALRPDAAAHFRLGVVLADRNKFDEAIACYRAALALDPGDAKAHYNLAHALGGLNRIDEALASYRLAFELDPKLAEARWNIALLRLLAGDFANGWRDYEWRWRGGIQPPHADYGGRPRWTGDAPLAGQRILLHAEQGFGDTIQFVRYANLLAARGATVLLEVQPELKPLLSLMPDVAGVSARGDKLPAFDCHFPLLSLPLAFATTPEKIPAEVPYLVAPPERVATWRARLAADGRRRIGIAWSGSRQRGNDHGRSIPLAALAPVLAASDCRFYAVQTECSDRDAATLAGLWEVVDLRPQLGDFADTAAILANLDLVITIDTAVAHLAGAMARPVWIMLPFAPAWRWLLGRDDSPWYPTARLFRQHRPGDWAGVIDRVRAALNC